MFLLFCCKHSILLSVVPSRWCRRVRSFGILSLFSHRCFASFFFCLVRFKLRLMTNFVKLVLKCYQLMAILNKSNYYYQQQNGKVCVFTCGWMKGCATHCRCRWLRCLNAMYCVRSAASTIRPKRKPEKKEKMRKGKTTCGRQVRQWKLVCGGTKCHRQFSFHSSVNYYLFFIGAKLICRIRAANIPGAEKNKIKKKIMKKRSEAKTMTTVAVPNRERNEWRM